MFKILALADEPSHYLEQRLAKAGLHATSFNAICACGDLKFSYLDSISLYARGKVFHVNGNHDPAPLRRPSFFEVDNDRHQSMLSVGVGENLHAKVIVFGDYLFCGFSGARSGQERPHHYSEREMRGLTRRVARRIRFLRWWDRIKGRQSKTVIVLSHAPPQGIQDESGGFHEGFACFTRFIQEIKPLLWMHGHLHLNAFNQIKKTRYAETTVVNVYEFKVITLKGRDIEVGYQL
jgi:Icc-related predicted phosphoesterase